MKYALLMVATLIFLLPAHAQQKYRPELKKQLDSILRQDQQYREFFANGLYQSKADSLAKVYGVAPNGLFNKLNSLMIATDTSDTRFIQQVIAKYGYPGKTLVGEESSSVAWSVLQHSNVIAAYLDLVMKAAKKGELAKKYAALMQDRVLMYSGKPQLYGTQGSYRKLQSGKSEMIIYPIKNPEKVNRRRKKMGFETTVEANAQLLGIAYRVIGMDELAK